NWGGAIYNDGSAEPAMVAMFGSTLRGNIGVRKGGAVFNQGGTTPAVAFFEAVTASGNASGGDGGALNNAGGNSLMALASSTVTNNRADKDSNGRGIGGGVWADADATQLSMVNTIVAGNLFGAGTDPDDIAGAFASAQASFNLIGVNTNLTLVDDGTNLIGTFSSP